MDDLNKDTYKVWELRLKLESLKKKLRIIIAALDSGEYLKKHGQIAYQEMLNEVKALKVEQYKLEEMQERMESKVKLENPYLKN